MIDKPSAHATSLPQSCGRVKSRLAAAAAITAGKTPHTGCIAQSSAN